MRIILPMAGHGARFRDAGYTVDKPLIEINGFTLLEWALTPIPKDWEKILIVRKDQPGNEIVEVALRSHFSRALNADNIERVLANKLMVVQLPGSTRGAAMTVLTAALALPPDEPVACMNCDQWFTTDPDLDKITATAMACGWDGYILTFGGKEKPWPGPAWSYAVCDEFGFGQVRQVIEKPKENVSPHATVGFYWWRRAGDLVQSICEMIGNRWTVNGEYYLAPSYNVLLGWKSAGPGTSAAMTLPTAANVHIVTVREFAGLGTPEQVKSFEQAALVREP